MQAKASHVLAADLTYTYAGTAANPYQYRVRALVFQDRSSAVSVTNELLTCGKNECGNTLPGSFTSWLALTRIITPPPSSCTGGIGITNYEIAVLEGLVQLPPARWTLSINLENRQVGIGNLNQSDTQSAYVAALLDNTAGLINSSPRFISNRLIQLSGTQPQPLSLSAFDSEGDSLVYQLVMPQRTLTGTLSECGSAVNGTLAPHFQLQPATGELQPRPNLVLQGKYALAARVDEYRRVGGSWQQIGSITRDIMYKSVSSSNQNPAFTSVERTDNPGVQLLGQPISVAAGASFTLNLTAADADAGQTLQLSSDAISSVPGVTFQDQGNGQGQLSWQVPATLPPGRYVVTVNAVDDACPFAGIAQQTLVFRVLAPLATQPWQPLAVAPHPVPFQDEVRFQLQNVGRQRVLILDGLGRVVEQLTTEADGSLSWHPASTLPAGLYLARTPDGAQVARLPYSGQ